MSNNILAQYEVALLEVVRLVLKQPLNVMEHRKPSRPSNQCRVAMLAPGVLAIEDSMWECDTFFHRTLFIFTNPDVWTRSSPWPLLDDGPIEILPGAGRAPVVSTIEQSMEFVRSQLVLVSEACWYQEPIFLDPQTLLPV